MNCKICGYNNKTFTYFLINSKIYKCSNCGFHYSGFLDAEFHENPKMEINEISEDFKIYLRNQLQSNKARFVNHVNIASQHISNIREPKILDIGTGGGLFLSLMSKAFGERINCYGIELDPARLQFSKEEYALQHIYQESIQSLFWNNHRNSFDLITLWDVIEHVNSPREVFLHAKSLLKKDGVLIMDTPCRNTFYHRFGELTYKITRGKIPSFLNIMYSDHPYGHKQIFSEKEIKKMYEQNGFFITGFNVFHELSFPNEFYLKKMFKNQFIVKLLNPIVTLIFKLLRVKNKMLIEGKLIKK